MNFWRLLRGGCIVSLVFSFAFVGFWMWARDDLFPQQLTLSAPPRGFNRAAVVSHFNFQGDGWHSIGVSAIEKWRKWTNLGTIPYLPDQNWHLIWARDGSLVALQQAPGMLGEPRLKTAQFTHAFDFIKNKKYDSDAWPSRSAFSRHIESVMKSRGRAVAGRETKREVGVWRWQDRELKDAL